MKALTSALSFLSVFLAPHHAAGAAAPRAETAYIQQVADGETRPAAVAEKRGKQGWWARSWTRTDGAGFFGKPTRTKTVENPDSTITLRYTRYSTEYDVEFHSPVWGAYTINAVTVANDESGERPASNPDFARPGQFFQEPLVLNRSTVLDVVAASHGTFTSTFDPRYPPVKVGNGVTAAEAKRLTGDRAIQRGHMVPNNAMKSQGTVEEGQTAQIESFSVANIVPQMAKSNAPTWAALEGACFDWAKELGQVWLFVGPVYRDRESPVFIRKVKDGAEQVVPSPDALYYVVIGRRTGVTAAIGFLVPHVPDVIDFRAKAVPVDEIERITGLNFMPDLGEPNQIETIVEPVWLQTRFRGERREDDR